MRQMQKIVFNWLLTPTIVTSLANHLEVRQGATNWEFAGGQLL